MEQIKCYCGHTTYCDCGPLEEPRKETAVEWLQAEIDNKDMGEIPLWIYEFIQQAKAMEEENQLNLIMFLRTQDKMGKSVEDLLKQYNETHESNT